MSEIERRIFCMNKITVEMRDNGDSKTPVIRGYAAVFDTLSENLGGFREKISPGAFDGVLDNDVRALFNHEPNMILGRTASGTLRIKSDSQGLQYDIDPPDTQYARDLAISIGRGDVTQSSFAFRVDEDTWDEDEDGRIIRTIKKFKELRDVSPVTFPAYPDATVALRSMDDWKKQHAQNQPSYEDEQRVLRARILEVS